MILFRIGAAISIRIVCKHDAPSDWVSWNQIQSNYNGQSKERENTFKSQWEFEIYTIKLSKARENAGNQVMIGLGFASDLFFFIIFGKLGSYSLKTWSAIFHGRGWHIYAGAEYPKLLMKGWRWY